MNTHKETFSAEKLAASNSKNYDVLTLYCFDVKFNISIKIRQLTKLV